MYIHKYPLPTLRGSDQCSYGCPELYCTGSVGTTPALVLRIMIRIIIVFVSRVRRRTADGLYRSPAGGTLGSLFDVSSLEHRKSVLRYWRTSVPWMSLPIATLIHYLSIWERMCRVRYGVRNFVAKQAQGIDQKVDGALGSSCGLPSPLDCSCSLPGRFLHSRRHYQGLFSTVVLLISAPGCLAPSIHTTYTDHGELLFRS